MFMFLLGLMLLMLSILVFYFSLYFMVFKLSYYFQWEVFMFNSFSVELVVLLDWMSLIFLSVVFIISSMVMFYSMGYMHKDLHRPRFFKLLIMFVISMVFLVVSPNMMSILIGWDGLGLISYCLVVYYSNYTSYNFGMITFICNRIGDVGLLMLISLMMMKGSWNLLFYEKMPDMIIVFLVISCMTKSAQIPFSTWLPKAMAAPTPVSSLVHSSTLVTAGVYLVIRYNYLIFSSFMSSVLMVLSSMTMLMAGAAANVENDLKKIIALSTLSQLGLMMSILSMGQYMLAFFHLLTHAMFKSLLFLSAGCVIHNFGNNQDIRLMGCLSKFVPFTVMTFLGSSFSLMGFPFLSGFYSKDLIMEFMLMSGLNMACGLMLLLGTVLTVSYSVRLMMFMVFGPGKLFSWGYIHEDSYMNFSMISLFFFSSAGGNLLSFLYFDKEDVIVLDTFMKLLIMILFFSGVFLGFFLYYLNFIFLSFFTEFLYALWHVDRFISLINSLVYLSSYLFQELDKVWLEFSWMYSFFLLLSSFNLYFGSFSLFNFIQFFIIIIFLIFFMI